MDRATTLTLAAILVMSGCAKPHGIIVGSKNFTEQDVLGEILAQHIERRLHLPVERKPHIGGTLLAHEALVSGGIDLYPEYTGTALTAILKLPTDRDPAATFRSVAAEYAKRWRLAWMPPFGFNNTFAMTVRGETARARRVATLSEAARAGTWNLGAGYEFVQRADGLAGLEKTYNLRMQTRPVTMDLGLLYQALVAGKVDLIAANSTDGLLAARDLVVLRDDRNYFPPYECAVVVREQTLAEYRELRRVLAELQGSISEQTMRKLNFRADGEHQPVRVIASEFLDQLSRTRQR